MLTSILKFKLGILAQMYLRRYQPVIIGVTGNVGKTSTKEMIGAILKDFKTVRVSAGNLNNDFGIPLTIFGGFDDEYYTNGPSPWFWAKVLWVSFFRLIFNSEYPQALVLEYGADHPGDIKKLVLKYRPHISVITSVGEIPVHVEFFKDADALADEKSNLIKCLTENDFAVLNIEDERVRKMEDRTRAKVITYGQSKNADVWASDLEIQMSETGHPLGVTFKINKGESLAPVKIKGSLGRTQALSTAAATAVGLTLSRNMAEISNSLRSYKGPKGRLKILSGINNSHIIDDTYNASPASTRLALETLREVPALRKIAVLGDMLELGDYSERAHQEIGRLAAQVADVIICVGEQSKHIADSAYQVLPVYVFETSDQAKDKVKELIREHDLILIKGSQSMRMEKIVVEILADPQQASQLLVRQSRRWRSK